MGGKKKSLANKLAKMSDEERARYLQHKADMEEEARRRKEQLISTFLKKKIKKEEMFSRLNLAKINQHWHQILRKTKCQEMKENVGHMRNWIERVINYKNRTISKLMKELEEAEEQYSNNFKSHSTYIDNIIDNQHQYLLKLQKRYEEDLEQLIEISDAERDNIIKYGECEEQYLRTVLFGEETGGKKELRTKYEHYKQKEYEYEREFDETMTHLTNSLEESSAAIWGQIAAVERHYEEEADSARLNYDELRSLDAESAAEIAANEERIGRQEDLLENLRKEDATLHSDRELRLNAYKSELKEINYKLLKEKQRLQRELQTDEKNLKLLSHACGESLKCLKNLASKGEQIKNLAAACEKFKTQRDLLAKWLPVTTINGYIQSENGSEEQLKDVEGADLDPLKNEAMPKLKTLEDALRPGPSKTRPKTAITGRILKSALSITDTSTPESRKITTVKKVELQKRDSQEMHPSSSITSSSSTETLLPPSPGILERCLDSLKGMENFWFMFNNADVDYMELKEEKRNLEKENKQLRGMIRAVLETVALAQSIPNSKVPTRAPSKIRSAQSAPFRRIVFV